METERASACLWEPMMALQSAELLERLSATLLVLMSVENSATQSA
jgi:hypothetical protein